VTEFPEDPRASSSSQSGPGGRAGAATEAELWLRRELAFLQRVERRILRRARWRREAWRGIVVGVILAVFALCWYLAALATDGSANRSCTGKATTTAAAQGSTTHQSGANQATTTSAAGGTAVSRSASGTATSCGN
jgi:Mg/Co/Ni transporter MgtE